VLQDVKYLQVSSLEAVPEKASQVYALRETLHKYLINLDMTVYWYNNVRQTVIEVEYPLIERQMNDLDEQLLIAENQLTWTSEGMIFY